MKAPLCSTGLCPLRGRCPASSHSISQSHKAGQRVSLTTYCPWATCSIFLSIPPTSRHFLHLPTSFTRSPALGYSSELHLPPRSSNFPLPLSTFLLPSSLYLPFWAAATKGLMTYAFTQGNFLLLLLLLQRTPPRGPNPSFEAQIPAWRLKSQPRGSNPSLEGQIPA